MNRARVEAARSRERVRVLVVEDDDDQRALLSTVLGRAGCDVWPAGTAEEAIVAIEIQRPELAVVDLMLPGIDGWELVRRIKETIPDCPIAVTSALEPRKFPDGVLSLPKPFTREQVLAVLGRAVPSWRST
jgi:Response regulator containing CheY-like receiver, AAA-type ATPase, and DNA-binding domains